MFFPPEGRGVFDKKYKVCHNLNWSADNENNLCWIKILPAKICSNPLVMKGRKKIGTENARFGS